MKLARRNISGASLLLLAIQLALVCSVAATYLYQRWSYPRIWARTVAIDPSLPMRGRYLSLRLTVDGCQSSLPSGKLAMFPRDVNGVVKPGPWTVAPGQPFSFPAQLKVVDNKLVAIRPQEGQETTTGQFVSIWPGAACDQMRLNQPVDFFIPEHAALPLPVQTGQELWIEVTIPPNGPPRPIQLALKQDNAWKPLAFQ
jgi:hypothetical protein